MFINNDSGGLAEKFLQSSLYQDGTLTPGVKPKTALTTAREKAELQLLASPDVDKAVTSILKKAAPQLKLYVKSKGELPDANPILLGMQAALLRANDISYVINALDVDDQDGLIHVEEAEQDCINTGSSDSEYILPPKVQAALKLTIDEMSKADIKAGGSGMVNQVIAKIKNASQRTGANLNAINALYVPDHQDIGTKSPGGSSLGNISFPDNVEGFNTVDTGPITATGGQANVNNAPGYKPPASTGTSWLDSLTSIFGAVSGVIGQVSNVVNQGQQAAGGVVGAVKDLGSDVGADSINKSILGKLPIIIASIVGIILIIILIVYVAKRK